MMTLQRLPLTMSTLRLALLATSLLATADSFQVPTARPKVFSSPTELYFTSLSSSSVSSHQSQLQRPSSTACSMFLPPSGGGGGNKEEGIGEVASGILTFLGVTAFFLSPLGGIFFALFNSLIALAFIIPVAGIAAFNIWQFANTVSDPCPSCGAPARAMKDGSPSFCFNCGEVIQAKDGKLFLANTGSSIMDDFQDEGAFGWLNELGGVRRTPVDEADKKKKYTRETTVIDVDVEPDE